MNSLLMRKVLTINLFLIFVVSWSQEVEVLSPSDLQKQISSNDIPLKVFNFWATWCGPCIKEIPYFEEYADRNDVKVILVSMDYPSKLSKVKKFVEKKGIKNQVVLLDILDYNSFIGSIGEDWSGAIPATLFVNKRGERDFYEKEFSKDQLNEIVNKHLNQIK